MMPRKTNTKESEFSPMKTCQRLKTKIVASSWYLYDFSHSLLTSDYALHLAEGVSEVRMLDW